MYRIDYLYVYQTKTRDSVLLSRFKFKNFITYL